MDKITKLYPKGSGKNPDAVLEQAIGQFNNVLIIGWDKNDALDVRSDTGLEEGDMLFLAELFKTKLMNGEYPAEESE